MLQYKIYIILGHKMIYNIYSPCELILTCFFFCVCISLCRYMHMYVGMLATNHLADRGKTGKRCLSSTRRWAELGLCRFHWLTAAIHLSASEAFSFRFVSFYWIALKYDAKFNDSLHFPLSGPGHFSLSQSYSFNGQIATLCVWHNPTTSLPSTLNPSVVFLMRQLWQSIAKSAESKEQRISCLHLFRWDATNKILIKAQHSFTLEDFYSQTPNLLFLPPLSCCVCN